MNSLIRVVIIGGSVMMAACGWAPPKDMESRDFLDFAEDSADEIVAAFNDFSAFDLSKPYWLPNPLLWHFPPGQEIHFLKKPYPADEIDSSVLCYLAADGQIVLNRDFYFTMNDNSVLAYSFDKMNWYLTDGDPREYEAFIPDIRFHQIREENTLFFSFSWAVREGHRPKPAYIPQREIFNRELISLGCGQVCFSTDPEDRAINLRRSVFFVPAQTAVGFRWDVVSNFFSFRQTDSERTVLKPLRDLYLYRKNRIVSLGFEKADGISYRDTFFSYRFSMKQQVVSDENGFPTIRQHLLIINKNLNSE